ncbi:hypothetical protein Tco_0510524 [Tanacetum coccineum]
MILGGHDDGGTRKDYRRTFPRGCPATLPEESPEQHAGYSFSLIHGIVSLGSRLTPNKSTRNSSELHALLYEHRTKRALALSEPEYSLRCEDLPQQIGAIRGTLSQSQNAQIF